MATRKSPALAVFCSAVLAVILICRSDAVATCNSTALHVGTISCGDTVHPSGYAATWYIFDFQANAGDIIAFTAAHSPGGGTLALAVQDTTCATTFMSDGEVLLTETATICPFTAPETAKYVLYVSAVGRHFVPFSLSMICLNEVGGCVTVPVEQRTWGRIKTLYH